MALSLGQNPSAYGISDLTDPTAANVIYFLIQKVKATRTRSSRGSCFWPSFTALFVLIEQFWIMNHFGIEAFGWQRIRNCCRW